MGKKSGPPDPPDYSKIAAASEKSAKYAFDLGKEQLAWAKETWAADNEITKQVSSVLIKTLNDNATNAAKDRERYEAIYQPLEDDLAADAASYATDARRDQEVGQAQAGVAQQFRGARESAQRQLEGYGINPSATRFGALDLGARVDEAAAKAAAGNVARDRVDATGRALRSEAINVGRGYPGQVAGTYGTAMNAGNSAVGNANQTTQTGGSVMGTAPQYLSAGNQALGTWGNTLNQGYSNQLAAWQAKQSQSSGLGGLLGTAAGIAFGFDEGGVVPEGVSPSGGAIPDDVNARLTSGEFIVPREAVEWLGQKHFHSLIEKAEKERSSAIPQPQVIEQRRGALPAGA